MKIAIVGVTGLVGTQMLDCLEKSAITGIELIPVASARSGGRAITFRGKEYFVCTPEEAIEQQPSISIFSAGSGPSGIYAPQFAAKGCYVIDNSSKWRMDQSVPLVVPEINADTINADTKIISNPNCSTIQMVLALSGLHRQYRIHRLVISTYQSVTGTGVKAVRQLEAERRGEATEMAYPHPIDMNCFPHGGDFLENGYTSEEMKLVFETRKILRDENIKVTATVVRIPVVGGHSEAVNVEFEKEYDLEEARTILSQTPGVLVYDNPQKNEYPMPRSAHGRDEVFVGRIRRDESQSKTLDMWIVADNLRKGAATNAVQIAEYLVANGFCN